MKKILTFATLILFFLLWVTAANATPITEGNQVTWRFELDSFVGSSFDAVAYNLYFTSPTSDGDQFDVGEKMQITWMDDIGDTPLVNILTTKENDPTTGFTRPDAFGAAWEADEDIYMEVRMVKGSVEVREDYPEIITFWKDYNNQDYVSVILEGKPVITSVPDASIMLLLGSSLMGLAVFSRKPKKG